MRLLSTLRFEEPDMNAPPPIERSIDLERHGSDEERAGVDVCLCAASQRSIQLSRAMYALGTSVKVAAANDQKQYYSHR